MNKKAAKKLRKLFPGDKRLYRDAKRKYNTLPRPDRAAAVNYMEVAQEYIKKKVNEK